MSWPRDDEAPALAGGGASGAAEEGNLKGDDTHNRDVKGTATTREKVAALMPLVERMHRGHYWRGTPGGPVCVKEPLDDFKLAQHCAGREAYGLCPIVPGESTCRVALLDFDSHDGATDWPGMVRTAREVIDAAALVFGLKGVAFRSGGGRGIHVYFLFDQPQDAHSVREALTEVLAACDLKPGTAGVAAGAVEAYPKQDRVEIGDFGSMAILPLARKSVLLDDDGNPLPRDAVVGLVWPMSESVPFVAQVPKPERVIGSSPDVDRLRSALAAIPNEGGNSLSYDNWFRLACAAHYATDGEGLEVFREWSARSSKHDDGFLETSVWPHLKTERGGDVITEHTLFALAAQHGWQDPTIADDFDVVEGDNLRDTRHTRFASIPFDEVLNPKPMSWLIKHVAPFANVAMLFGAAGSGKSFLALDIAAAVVRGVPWRGFKTMQGEVAYFVAEGAGGFRQRIRAYIQHNGPEAAQALRAGLRIHEDGPNLLVESDVKAFIEVLRAEGSPRLVIIDTLAQATPGANENSSEDMGLAANRCKIISQKTGAMVVMVHHSGKDIAKGARGWSGLKGAVDVELEVSRDGDNRTLTVSKLKEGVDGAMFGFKLLDVPLGMDDDGEVYGSCVVEHGPVAAKVWKPKGALQKAVIDAVDDLQGLAVDGAQVSRAEVLDRAFDLSLAAEPLKADTYKAQGNRRQSIRGAFEALVFNGLLSDDDHTVMRKVDA